MSHENPQTPGNYPEESALSPIDQEKLRLLDDQQREALILETTGIADKAREVLQDRYTSFVERMSTSDIAAEMPEEPVLDGPSVQIAVVQLREKYGSDARIYRPAIRFSRLQETTSGHAMVSHNYVNVSHGTIIGSGDELVPAYDFTPEDVGVVEGMLLKRRHDAENGVFPQLTPDLGNISDPSTAMMARPRQA